MSGTATCDGQIAIGGSMLLAEERKTELLQQPDRGRPDLGRHRQFRGAHGRVKSTSIGNTNNSDITITFTG